MDKKKFLEMKKEYAYLFSFSFFCRDIAIIRKIRPMIETNRGIAPGLMISDVPVAMMRRNPKTASGRANFAVFIFFSLFTIVEFVLPYKVIHLI